MTVELPNDFVEKIAPCLTWHPYRMEDHIPDGKYSDYVTVGTLLKEADGIIYLVGSAMESVYDLGCGCCSDNIRPVEYAHLSELFEILEE